MALRQILPHFRCELLQVALVTTQLPRQALTQGLCDGDAWPLACRIRSVTSILSLSARSTKVRILRAQFSPMVTLNA